MRLGHWYIRLSVYQWSACRDTCDRLAVELDHGRVRLGWLRYERHAVDAVADRLYRVRHRAAGRCHDGHLQYAFASSVHIHWHTDQVARLPAVLVLLLTSAQHSCWDGRPFGHNRHWPKSGGLLCPFPWGGAGSPSNKMWHGPRPTSVPSGILIRPTVWPQYTNVTDRTDRTTVP